MTSIYFSRNFLPNNILVEDNQNPVHPIDIKQIAVRTHFDLLNSHSTLKNEWIGEPEVEKLDRFFFDDRPTVNQNCIIIIS